MQFLDFQSRFHVTDTRIQPVAPQEAGKAVTLFFDKSRDHLAHDS
jgi:hypothetical protein